MIQADKSQIGKLIDWASFIERLKARSKCQVQARPVPKAKVPVPKLDFSFIKEEDIAMEIKAAKKAIRREEIRAYKSGISELFRIYGGSTCEAAPKVRKARGAVLPAKVGKTGTDVKNVKKRSTIVELPFIF